MTTALRQYVIYYDTREYPRQYVVHGWTVDKNGPRPDKDPTAVVLSLEHARVRVPLGLYRMDRWDEDNPCVVEVWT